ncbi:MAG: hypothetical protein H6835_09565 [Planctomycetes bacterium]|nr:hypothetical protein [Planctomycetota bacterium]
MLTGAALAQVAGPRRNGGAEPQQPQQPQAQRDERPASEQFQYSPVLSRYLRLDPFDRYGVRRPWNPLTMSDGTGEYPILQGAGLLDVYNTNKWKGDLPVIGENTFFAGQVLWNNLVESRDKANSTHADEVRSTMFATADFFHGDTVFRPATWRVRATFAFDERNADDVDNGNTQGDIAVQEMFGEMLLWEMDPYLDFGSIRVGRQAFASDFRNFIFQDNNDAVKLFGSFWESRIDFEFAFFDLVAKDPFSNLNRGFLGRDQQYWSASVFLEDMLAMGYKVQFTMQGAHDTSRAATIDAYYAGFNGQGRIGKIQVAHALYWMFGEDEGNKISGAKEDINAQMAALEIAIPDSWARYVFSALYASGDSNVNDGKGTGFDSVFDNPAFAGGANGFFHRQAIAAGGQGIANTNSFYPNLRTKAFEGPNSVNPGLFILHTGYEATLSNYWTAAVNAAYLSFVNTASLEQATGRNNLDLGIGFDLSLTAQWRPLGVDNCIITPGVQMLVPTGGLADLTNEDALFAFFVNAAIVL